jgi:flagellar basal body-associated protein FliL
MLLFSSQKFADIKTREGKLKLQHEALQVVQKALGNITGGPVIDALYLSSLVGQ